ncbi:MAG: FAD-binding oxidoreductase, partial [Promethearchaeota archaeon]
MEQDLILLENLCASANASMFRRIKYQNVKAVIHPTNEEEARQAILHAKAKGLTITPKGAGSSLSGASTGGNFSKIILTTHKLDHIKMLDLDREVACVQSGVTPDQLNQHLKNTDYRFFVTPSSKDIATIGGMISTDAGGNDAWLHGTMRDNLKSVTFLDSKGRAIRITATDVSCEDKNLEQTLRDEQISLNDVVNSHGVLGFIIEAEVKLNKVVHQQVEYGVLTFSDLDHYGTGVVEIIKNKIPLTYSEAVVQIPDWMHDKYKAPLLILSFPGEYQENLESLAKLHCLDTSVGLEMQEFRRSLPKRTPRKGTQLPYFEGYGFSEQHLLNFGEMITELNSLWQSNGLEPFMRYGHSPCKWYVDDNETFGLIMHAREVKAEKNGKELVKILNDVVQFCKEKEITPKPEHKWPYMQHEYGDDDNGHQHQNKSIVNQALSLFVKGPGNCHGGSSISVD